jgi:hypothetical protein
LKYISLVSVLPPFVVEETVLKTGEVPSELAKSSLVALLSEVIPAEDILSFADITAFIESFLKKFSTAVLAITEASSFVSAEGLSGASVAAVVAVVTVVPEVLFPPAQDANEKILVTASKSANAFFILLSPVSNVF